MSDSNEKTRVQVAVRIRPVAEQENGDRNKIVVHALDETTIQTYDETRGERQFKFDNVLVGDQASVFAVLGQPMLEEAYKGFNVCLFAYGQTGSGKTYSILGDIDAEEQLGLAPRFVRSLFSEAQRRVEDDPDLTIKVTLSMVEVYMEKVRDLLAPRVRGQEPESLEVREDASRRVYVKGAGTHPVLSYERMIELLKKGNANRQTAETRMNETSSRSHAIMQITITQEYKSIEKKDLECTATLVDLAGSERQTKAESTGHHFEEAKKINHSLLMLGRALNSFSERRNGEGFISLRESKLTRLLSESFGGNSKTWMLGTVSPTAYNLTETISTLEYASNAMAITNKARINKSMKDLEYDDLVRLRAALHHSVEKENALIERCETQCSNLASEMEVLKRELCMLNDTKVEQELQDALAEREVLKCRLLAALLSTRSGSSDPLICFSGVCRTSLAAIEIGSYDVMTLVVPFYELAGPPPLLHCQIHLDLTADEDVVVVVHIKELCHLPDFATGGSQVTLWFEGHASNKVSTPIATPNAGNPQFHFKQSYLFGPLTDELRSYIASDVLLFQVDGLMNSSVTSELCYEMDAPLDY